MPWGWGMGRKKSLKRDAGLLGLSTIISSGDVQTQTLINYTGTAELSGFATHEASGSVSVLELQGGAQLLGAAVIITGVMTGMTSGAIMQGAYQASTSGAVFVPPVSLVGAATMVGTGKSVASGSVQAPVLVGYGSGPYGDGYYGG